MGIYFDNTTPEEDAEIILNLVKKGEAYHKEDKIYHTKHNYVLWKKQDHVDNVWDQFVIFENYGKGILTSHGIDAIRSKLMREGRFSTTY